MKRFYLIALLVCSSVSSGCYAVVEGNPNQFNNSAIHLLFPWALPLPAAFAIIGAVVALATKDKDRRGAALAISVGALVVFFLIIG